MHLGFLKAVKELPQESQLPEGALCQHLLSSGCHPTHTLFPFEAVPYHIFLLNAVES